MEVDQKALEINLRSDIYGTFAEIGAGQEVARQFFRAGGSSGTIAKTMSAYDKTYSDEIYGPEPSGRYVCESRIYKMLEHEFLLLETRLGEQMPETRFFAFANTVAAINYTRTIKGDGWMGLRFLTRPGGEFNDLVLHVNLLDNANRLQQEAVGLLGVNMIYACFFLLHDMDAFIQSLADNLTNRVSIDMIRLSGPDVTDIDNRSLSFKLVNHGLSPIAIFGPDGQNLHPSEFLYKKHVLVVRGSFKPVTWMSYDMIRSAAAQYAADHDLEADSLIILTEITLDTLARDHAPDEIDFLERAEMLCTLGFVVCISSGGGQQKIVHYLEDFKVPSIGVAMTAGTLARYIDYVSTEYKDYGLLTAFGDLFTGRVRLYVYPSLMPGTAETMHAVDVRTSRYMSYLYRFLLDSGQIIDITEYNTEVLHISASGVQKKIRTGQKEWETYLPEPIAALIREKKLLGYLK
jgi:hypothetical protein